MRRGRRTTRWSVAAAVACGVLATSAGLAPTAAQEPAGETTTTTTTTAPAAEPGTAPPTTTDPTAPGTTPPGAPTTDTTAAPTAPTDGPAAPSAEPAPSPPADPAPSPGGPVAATEAALVLDLAPGAQVDDGQALAFSVPGLGDVMYVEVMQCAVGDEPSYERCRYEYGQEEVVEGTLRGTLRLDAVLTLQGQGAASPRSVDCRVEACEIVVRSQPMSGSTVTLGAPLPFDPDAPLAPPPTASLTPAGPYVHGQAVTVQAAGLVWDPEVVVAQCATGATTTWACDSSAGTSVALDDRTAAEVGARLLAVIDTGGGAVDCRTAGACELVVTNGYDAGPQRSVALPLAFDPTTEVVAPTLTVSPADGLVHGQVVTATGSGFIDRYAQFSQCAVSAGGAESCVWTPGWAMPDAGGGFVVPVPVSVFVPTPDGEVDCRAPSAPCSLVASGSGPTSSRAGRVTLRFDPDGPMPPPPTISVHPATDLPEETSISVTGTGFDSADGSAELSVCRTGTTECDESARQWIEPAPDGTFRVDAIVGSSFTTFDGSQVDCRAEPGCSVVVRDGYEGRQATAALSFGEPPTMADRYRLPVFDEVAVTPGVVFRRATDAAGRAVDLELAVHEPAGDTVERRPAVILLDGGWFGPSPRSLTGLADAFARRGYVAVTMEYRSRPGLACCPTDDIEGVTAAVADATDDAAAGVRWLREHADEHGIDPDAIAVAGADGGAAAAFGLAHVVDAPVAAVVPVGGVGFGRPERGDPPFLAVHGRYDNVAPAHLSQWACTRARSLGTTCATMVVDDSLGDLAESGQRAVAVEASAFLADVVLAPLGYTEASGRDWGAPTGGDGTGDPGVGPLSPLVPGVAVVTTIAGAATGARLPMTGVGVGPLVAIASALLAVGAALLAARRWGVGARARRGRLGRLAGGEAGAARLWVAAGAAVVLVVAGFAVTTALESDGDTDQTAGGRPNDQDEPDAATDHESMDHDEMDHGDGDHDAPDHGELGHTALDHADDEHADSGHAGSGQAHRGAAAGHRHGGGTADGHAHDPAGPTGEHGRDPGDTGHQHPDPTPGHEHPDPSTPPHTHPDPDPTDPDPPTGFDPAWTPEQVAYAEQLIADTQEQLVRYDTMAILPLTGFQWIRDGREVGSYQHWIHLGRIIDSRRLDAAYPESLVLRTTADGPRLEAAMYMLSISYNLGNIPADIAWLPGWHIHDNLCFVGYELVGVTVNGVCERGSVLPTPPMIHVWREPTECGWFAGVDEFGLLCDHEH